MLCPKCRRQISDSSLNCCHCGNKIVEDYFGYQKADNAIRMNDSQPKKKDKTGKIILIVLSAVGSLFGIMISLLFAFSGGTGSAGQNTSDSQQFTTKLTVNNSFNLVVDGSSETYSVRLRSKQTASYSGDQCTVAKGEKRTFDCPEGVYDFYIMKSTSDFIHIELTVSNACLVTDVSVNYDSKQMFLYGEDGTSDVYDYVVENTQPAETTTAQQNQNSSGSSNTNNIVTNNNATANYVYLPGLQYDCEYLLSSVEVTSSNGIIYKEDISYSKDGDGYIMTINNVRSSGDYEYITAYFDSDKKLVRVIRDSSNKYPTLHGTITDEFTYDENGNLISRMTYDDYGNGVGVQYQLDSEGKIINEYREGTFGAAYEKIYSYNEGKMIHDEYLYSSTSATDYEYDGDNLIRTVSYEASSGEYYSSDEYTYDNLNRLTYKKTLDLYNSNTGDIESEYNYTYDGITLSAITGYEQFSGNRTDYSAKFEYDNYNNLINVEENNGGFQTVRKFGYIYDSYEYKGLLEEYCVTARNRPAENEFFRFDIPYVPFSKR